MRSNISIILVEPENPDNIGAVSRAMKNMGLSSLRLVLPPKDWKQKGAKMAVAAADLLQSAEVFETLEEATADMHRVVATTRRGGPKRGIFHPFAAAVKKISEVSRKHKVALLFGKESKGLDNRAIALSDWTITIPASREYPSINLAQAVMITAFSLFARSEKLQDRESVRGYESKFVYVSQSEVRIVLEKFRKALETLDYTREGSKVIDRIVVTFHGLLKRSALTQSEAQMLKGFTRRISEMAFQKEKFMP